MALCKRSESNEGGTSIILVGAWFAFAFAFAASLGILAFAFTTLSFPFRANFWAAIHIELDPSYIEGPIKVGDHCCGEQPGWFATL